MNITEFIDSIFDQLIKGIKKSVESQIEAKHTAYNIINLDKQEFINIFLTKEVVDNFKINNPYIIFKSQTEILDMLYDLEINKLNEILKFSVASESANLNFDFNVEVCNDNLGNQKIEIISKSSSGSIIQCKLELKIKLQN